MAKQKRYYVAKLPRTHFQGVRYVVRERGTSWEGYTLHLRKADAQAKANEMNAEGGGPNRFRNPMKRGKWMSGEIMVTKSGSVKFRKR